MNCDATLRALKHLVFVGAAQMPLIAPGEPPPMCNFPFFGQSIALWGFFLSLSVSAIERIGLLSLENGMPYYGLTIHVQQSVLPEEITKQLVPRYHLLHFHLGRWLGYNFRSAYRFPIKYA